MLRVLPLIVCMTVIQAHTRESERKAVFRESVVVFALKLAWAGWVGLGWAGSGRVRLGSFHTLSHYIFGEYCEDKILPLFLPPPPPLAVPLLCTRMNYRKVDWFALGHYFWARHPPPVVTCCFCLHTGDETPPPPASFHILRAVDIQNVASIRHDCTPPHHPLLTTRCQQEPSCANT